MNQHKYVISLYRVFRLSSAFYCIILWSSCSTTSQLGPDEFLLDQVKIEVEGDIDKDEIEAIVKQNPNRKLIGLFKFHLNIYNLVNKQKAEIKRLNKEKKLVKKNEKRIQKGKDPKVLKLTYREWLMNVVGEEPVVYDRVLTKKSTKNISQYLKNKGFFQGTVNDSVAFDEKKAEVYYKVQTGIPHKIRKVSFSINDTSIISAIQSISKKTIIKPSANYDSDILEQERSRITSSMKNLGYYNFSKEYVFFKIDSTIISNKMDVHVTIKNPVPEEVKDSSQMHHEIFHIDKVYIHTNSVKSEDRYLFQDTTFINGYYYIHSGSFRLRPEVLQKALFIKSGELFSQEKTEYTHTRLSGLRTYKYIRIGFEETYGSPDSSMLDCHIYLVPTAKNAIAIEAEGTNKGGFLGVGGNLVYHNKNAFRGGEVLELKFNGGAEVQQIITDQPVNETGAIDELIPFNTLEVGPELTLYIPDLLIPVKKNKLPSFTHPTTNLSLAYSHQRRTDYTRNLGKLLFGYSWNSRAHNSHFFYPVDLSFISIDKAGFFNDWLNEIDNSYITNSYQDHLITASKYSFIFNNQNINKNRNFTYLKLNLESAGNLLSAIAPSSGLEQNENGSYEVIGIQFAQYVKPELDLRLYKVVNKHSNIVYRLFGGIGIPYGNLNVLPFEKSYFSGGSNGIRAWTARSLGPGALNDSLNASIDKIGDIRLEANMEYRFSIIQMLEGALFVDAGNIWLRNEDHQRPGGNFEFNRFYKEIAVGAGIGARVDLNFFIVRLDMGIPLKDPSLVQGERWIFEPKTTTNEIRQSIQGNAFLKYSIRPIFNVGIGYPF